MKEERYFYCPEATQKGDLPEEEAIHAARVLRLNAGDEIFLIDGNGAFYRAEVSLISKKKCLYDIVETMPQKRQWKGRIRLAIAPTKNIDRIEWMAEKATEIGFDELTFLNCKYSERHEIRIDRIEKIIIAAMKQSRKAWKPEINGMTDFDDYISKPTKGLKFIAHCYEESVRSDFFVLLSDISPDEDVTIMIGPEGDFSVDEVQNAVQKGFVPVSLGTSRLRTETAGLAAIEMMRLTKRIV
jgi:16S rRNA (uracil1498-N3)-methyltransferase